MAKLVTKMDAREKDKLKAKKKKLRLKIRIQSISRMAMLIAKTSCSEIKCDIPNLVNYFFLSVCIIILSKLYAF